MEIYNMVVVMVARASFVQQQMGANCKTLTDSFWIAEPKNTENASLVYNMIKKYRHLRGSSHREDAFLSWLTT